MRKGTLFRVPQRVLANVGRFGAAHHQAPAHELLVVKFHDRPLGLLDGGKSHKGEPFRFLGFAVAHHFGALHFAHPGEELGQVSLSGIKRKIAHVQLRGSDFVQFRFADGFGGTVGSGGRSLGLVDYFSINLTGGKLGFFPGEERNNALEKAHFFRCFRSGRILTGGARATVATTTAPAAAGLLSF